MVKKKSFLISLSAEEHATLKKRAYEENISMAEYVRRKVFKSEEGEKREYPREY